MTEPRPPGTVALAPMDGVTDFVFRDLMTRRARRGGLAYCVSEFVRVTDRALPASVIRRSCPEVGTGGTTRAGVPVLVQLLGGQAEPLAETAVTAVRMGAWGIDLNFGCPAKTVNNHDGGATLLKAPERIERIVARVRAAVPKDRSVSAKIRLGWGCSQEVVPIALAAERGGASWLTVHGRTKEQMYGPPADWIAIGRARAAVSIPVVANGDLNDEASLERCAKESGCSHFMMGRGPMGRPDLVIESVQDPDARATQVTGLLFEYLDLLEAAGDSERRQVGRVKQWLSLGSRANPALSPVFERVKRLHTRADVCAALA